MEVLAMHADLASILTQPQSMQSLPQQARLHGYTTLAEEGLRLVRDGETSLQELRRVVDVSVLDMERP